MDKAYHKNIVPGLDALIGDPDILKPKPDTKKKADCLFIPEGYIYRINDFFDEMTNRGDASRELVKTFSDILGTLHNSQQNVYRFKNGMTLKIIKDEQAIFPKNLSNHNSSKAQAIASCTYVNNHFAKDGKAAIMTGSDKLANIAYLHGLDVAKINPEIYTGRCKAKLNSEQTNIWLKSRRITYSEWQDFFPEYRDQKKLMANQFIEFTTADYGQTNHYMRVGRFDSFREEIIPLKFHQIDNQAYRRILPKTPGQAMIMEALMAPIEEIPIVIILGTYGTGKTFMTCATGLKQVEDGSYERLFVCPRDSSLGKDIGFLPGDERNKVRAKAKPIEDNIREVIKMRDISQDTKLSTDIDLEEVKTSKHSRRTKKRPYRRQKIFLASTQISRSDYCQLRRIRSPYQYWWPQYL